MYFRVKTTGCTDLFPFVYSCRWIPFSRLRRIGQKKTKTNKTSGHLKQPVPPERTGCTSIFPFFFFAKPEGKTAKMQKVRTVGLYLLAPLDHLLEFTLCARRQDLNWKEREAVLSIHTAEFVAAWQRASCWPGELPPALSRPPCAPY